MKFNTKKGKSKKIVFVLTLTIIITLVLIIAFISPIAKWAIQKYDEKYLGRQIELSWVYLNPFTGYIHLSNVKIYEYKSDSLFLSADGLSANFQLFKMFKKTYEISRLTLSKPQLKIIQDHKVTNLDDIINRFTPKEKPVKPGEPLHFNLLEVKIKDGEFHYVEQSIPVNYFVKEVNFESTGMYWNRDTVIGKISFQSGPSSGDVKADFSINLKSLDYSVAAVIKKFDLQILEQYMRDFASYGNFSANLDADIKASGNFKEKLNMKSTGRVALNDFHFGKVPGDDFASFKKFVLQAKLINPKDSTYHIDSVMLDQIFFKYERYDYLDNLQRMFGKGGANYKAVKDDPSKFNLIVEIANYVEALAKNFVHSYFKVNKVAIYNGDIRFADFSLREKFSVAANPLYIYADSIDRNRSSFKASLNTDLKPYGSVMARLTFNPQDYQNFYLFYKLMKVPVTIANPYLISYTSFPLDRGTLDFNGYIQVTNGNIESQNHLVIVDPRVAKRIKKKDTKWIPVPFLMSLVRERGDVIDYFIPIKGNLKDPKFKVDDVIRDVLRNIFVKPPTTPYLIKVKKIETEIEKALTLKWEMRQTTLRPSQEKFIERIADFLKKDSAASINISPLQYVEKEKEHILFFEAKKKFAAEAMGINSQSLSEEDSTRLDKMSVKDSAFIHYLNKQTKDTLMFTVQEKCMELIPESKVSAKFEQLILQRQRAFLSYFKETEVEDRVKFNRSEFTVPFNGFSYYNINYKGDIPEKLQNAYEKLEEINSEPPREKYQDKRRKARKAAAKETDGIK